MERKFHSLHREYGIVTCSFFLYITSVKIVTKQVAIILKMFVIVSSSVCEAPDMMYALLMIPKVKAQANNKI